MERAVTFIIPTYNGVTYVVEAIESILKQTCGYWKLLLIDDGSTDGSPAIANKYSDSRITTFVNDRNLGLYPTLVKAISLVDSEWISILMQDDRLKPFYLEEILRLVAKYPAQAFWATEDVIGENGELLVKGRDTLRVEPIDPGVLPWISILNRGCIWTISGSLTHRNLLISTPFRADLPHTGDYEWLLRAIRHARFVYYERPLVDIRLHSRQASAYNLRVGLDIHEYYEVIRKNLFIYADDLPRRTAVAICWRRAKLIIRRALGRLVEGHLLYAVIFVRYAIKFMFLPFVYKKDERHLE